ncbi:MAG: TolC family protein [Geminicoccaceae bacterium]|nr:TolC family protein [Geminicoccaceae bacterium]
MTSHPRLPAATRSRCAILLATTLAGCALATPPDHETLLHAALPETSAIPVAWSTEGAPTSAVGGNWVASFDDPELARLVDEALRNNRDLQAAAARVEAALQSVVIAGAPVLPAVGVEAGRHTSRNYGTNDTQTINGAELVVSWEIDLWGRLRSGEAAAFAQAQAAADDAVYAQQSIAATVARVWVANIEVVQLTALAGESLDDYQRLVRLAQRKEAAGQVSSFDVVQARSRASAARAAAARLESRANETIAGLEVLLGRYPSLGLKPADSFPHMPEALSAGLPLSLLDRRADVTAARNQVIAAFYDVEVAKLARLPGVSLAASAGRLNDPDLALLAMDSFSFAKIGVGLLQPIFEGGALQAQVAGMTATQAAATALYGQTVLDAFGEVETRLANEQLLREELAAWRAADKDAREAVRLGEANYVMGTIDMVTLLDLVEFAIGVRMDEISTEAALLTNRIALYLALGESY